MIAQTRDFTFAGFTYNIDDSCVYSSWIRQVADGNLIIYNRFTSEAQHAGQFNIFFILLGLIARITHLSPAAVLHLSRIVLGVAALALIWRFSQRFLKDRVERLLIVPVVGLSSGLGWLLTGIGHHKGPTDLWQPESITFLSIYLNPLFLAGLILMIASLHFLYKMKESGSLRDASLAGVMLLLLGNVHTYDVLTVGAIWAVYLVAKMVKEKKIHWRTIGLSIAAVVISLPSVCYQFYLYKHEPIFAERVGTEALSPALWAYLLGYGLILVLAVVGAWTVLRERRGALILVVWSIAGFALPYLPFAQQRKLVMGLHIPLAILAVVAIATAARRIGPKLSGVAVIVMVMALIPSNLIFMARDIKMLGANMTAPRFRPYLAVSDIKAMQWLRHNTKPDEVVLAFPDVALFTPTVAGNQVYYGHWSETPDYKTKLNEWLTFADASTPDDWRQEFLRESGASYIVYPTHPEKATVQLSNGSLYLVNLSLRDYLELVYQTGETSVYKIKN